MKIAVNGREDLIANKKSVGRPKDIADIEELNSNVHRHYHNVMHATPGLRVTWKWTITRSGSVITDVVIRLEKHAAIE